MKLNRKFQLDLLQQLSACYPNDLDHAQLQELEKDEGFYANLQYLHSHELLEGNIAQSMSGEWYCHSIRASAKGMDFLADDGGLSAILGVVTIKLHDDTIKQLVEAKILQSDLPESEKKRYLAQLRELPAETTKHLVLKLVDLGLEKGPEAIGTIGRFLGGLQALS